MKLLRESVIDKIKNDFCPKGPERCLQLKLVNDKDNEMQNGELWSLLKDRLQAELCGHFDFRLATYEKIMIKYRCKAGFDRFDDDDTFCDYLLAQDGLALAFESFGMPAEALEQFEQLDCVVRLYLCSRCAHTTTEVGPELL